MSEDNQKHQQPIPVVLSPQPCFQEDEIDLFELWDWIVEQKSFVLGAVSIFLIAALSYVLVAAPVYEGRVVLQVGKLSYKTADGFLYRKIYNPKDMVAAINAKFSRKDDKKRLRVSTPRNTESIIDIRYQSERKADIIAKIDQILAYVRSVEQEVSASLKTYGVRIVPSHLLLPTYIDDEPVKPKKTLILSAALVLGLMVGVFGALLRHAIRNRKIRRTGSDATVN